jgi:hypothetical protein
MADSREPSNKQEPAKDSAEAKRRRTAAYRERKKAQGIASVTLQVPEASHGMFQKAASLIRDGTEPGEAFRLAGAASPVTGRASPRR